MEISSAKQAQVFLGMVICGAVCTLIFDVFRAIRRFKKPSAGVIVFQDLVFWAIEIFTVYMVSFKLNYAGLRVYLIIALVIGSVLYFITLSEPVISGTCRLIEFFCRAFEKIIFPFVWIFRQIFKPIKKQAKFVKLKIFDLKQKVKKRLNFRYKVLFKKLKTIFSFGAKKENGPSNSKIRVDQQIYDNK